MTRIAYLTAGWICVALGVIGILLPLLPTTPLMILAAFLFTRGSPAARGWLVDHTRFGPHIRAWEAEGAIAPRAKRMAIAAMVLVFAISVALALPGWVLAIQALCLAGAAAFILTRPDPAPEPAPDDPGFAAAKRPRAGQAPRKSDKSTD